MPKRLGLVEGEGAPAQARGRGCAEDLYRPLPDEQLFDAYSRAVMGAVDKASPSVVSIEVEKRAGGLAQGICFAIAIDTARFIALKRRGGG